MGKVVFFSFSETDRDVVLTIKGRAVNSNYNNLDFRVQDLLKRWDTEDPAVIRRAISQNIDGASKTIVFVGNSTYKSYWVTEEVRMTLQERKPVFAIRLKDTNGQVPTCLSNNNIPIYAWSEQTLQILCSK